MGTPVIYNLQGEKLFLLPEKALYRPCDASIIVADIHLGKATHFSRNGLPLSPEAGREDIERLRRICLDFRAEKLLVLGDLFHSDFNAEFNRLDRLLEVDGLQVELVAGNHDIIDRNHYLDKGITVHENSVKCGPFHFVHDPLASLPAPEGYRIGGHIHPGVRLSGKARQAIKLPCFVFRADYAVLPAFGSLTGMHEMKFTAEEDEFYAVAAGKVLKVPSPFKTAPSSAP